MSVSVCPSVCEVHIVHKHKLTIQKYSIRCISPRASISGLLGGHKKTTGGLGTPAGSRAGARVGCRAIGDEVLQRGQGRSPGRGSCGRSPPEAEAEAEAFL